MKKPPRTLVRSACPAIGLAALLIAPAAFAQTDRIYFPAIENVRSALVSSINAETVRIDMSAWYLTEHAVSIALVDALNRGVQVRLIGDRGAIFEIDPKNKTEFYWLASQGVPIRLRVNPTWFPEIDHWKATIFKGQRLVAFGSANYTPSQLAPDSPTNYSDETVLFTTDPALVNAFLSKFDQYWNDTTAEPQSITRPPYFRNWDQACAAEAACSDYRTLHPNPVPMRVSTARLEPDHPTAPDLIWGQGAEFNSRLVQEINSESSRIDFAIYRLTVNNITQALLGRFLAGVPTRLIIEPNEYLNRKWPEFWLTHANLDKLWAAGVPMKQRQHDGLTHMKMLVTSRYATNASSNFAANWQRDTNYFVSASAKSAIYQAMADRFDAMWNDSAGFTNFVPQPPARPLLSSPPSGSAGVPRTQPLVWQAAPFATAYDVYLGPSEASQPLVASLPAVLTHDPPGTYSWTPASPLAPLTTYHWRVVARTNATARDPALVATSATWSFVTTEGTSAPFQLSVSPASLRFAGTNSGGALQPVTPSQAVTVSISGGATWTATADQPWLQVTGAAGTGSGQFRVSIVNPSNVLGGSTELSGSVRVSAGSVETAVAIRLTLRGGGSNDSPFGQVDTPAQGEAGVVGAIGVTGWALDDVGVTGVKIYRNCFPFDNQADCQLVGGAQVVYIGDAAFLAGARPDVEAAFPGYPQSHRAGWGYLMLTNMLPHAGNGQVFGGHGPLTLYAFASDADGSLTLLGRSQADHTPTSVTVANDTIAKPFGAIDTPGQGETVSGTLVNFGWVLTPDSDTVPAAGDFAIPGAGSTVRVFIDGVDVGQVAYDQCRGSVGNPVPAGVYCNDDVSNIFGNPAPRPPLEPRSGNPTRFRNLDAGRGAIGSFVIDTTRLANGLHTIAWSVTDSAGRSEGIGSRFFYVVNAAGGSPR